MSERKRKIFNVLIGIGIVIFAAFIIFITLALVRVSKIPPPSGGQVVPKERVP